MPIFLVYSEGLLKIMGSLGGINTSLRKLEKIPKLCCSFSFFLIGTFCFCCQHFYSGTLLGIMNDKKDKRICEHGWDETTKAKNFFKGKG